MGIPDDIKKDTSNSKTLYDFMAWLFLFLTKLVPRNKFSNLALQVETNKVSICLKDYFNRFIRENNNEAKIFLPQVYNEFMGLIEDVLQVNKVEAETHDDLLAGLFFVLLQNIDSCFDNIDVSNLHQTYGPLNSQPNTCVIYFRGNESHHKEKSKSFGRERIGPYTINDFIDNFIFIRKDDLPEGAGIPRIIHLSRTQTETLKGVTFACFPWGRTSNFRFIESERFITVDYQLEDKEITKKRITGFISKALTEIDPNIIIFPEYSISPYGLEVIKTTIKDINSTSRSNHLDFIVAGSTWQKNGADIQENNNNIMTIIDKLGNEIGKYYKYSRYTKSLEKRRKVIERQEKLDDPGKEITLIHLDNLGIILPSICRDTYDGSFTKILAELFLPSYVLTIAYSPSVSSFVDPFKNLTNRHHINLIFCNYCESIKENADISQKIGFAGSATLATTVVSFSERYFQRDSECVADCDNKTCFFKVNFKWQENGGDKIAIRKYIFPLNVQRK